MLEDLKSRLKDPEDLQAVSELLMAEAIRYALGRLPKARAYLNDGHLEPDNNICERSIRPVALGRKNYLFMGSVGGGKAAAIAYSLTCSPMVPHS